LKSSAEAAIDVESNRQLASLTGFSALETAGTIRVVGNEALRALDLGRLRNVEYGIIVSCNPALPEASLEGLWSQIPASSRLGTRSDGSLRECGAAG